MATYLSEDLMKHFVCIPMHFVCIALHFVCIIMPFAMNVVRYLTMRIMS